MGQSALQRQQAITALVQESVPEYVSEALAELVVRLSESNISITEAAWITLCEIFYPRPWPDLWATPMQGPRPARLPSTFDWERWAQIRLAVHEAIPNLSMEAWRILFEEFLADPTMTVEAAVRRARQLADQHPAQRPRHRP